MKNRILILAVLTALLAAAPIGNATANDCEIRVIELHATCTDLKETVAGLVSAVELVEIPEIPEVPTVAFVTVEVEGEQVSPNILVTIARAMGKAALKAMATIVGHVV